MYLASPLILRITFQYPQVVADEHVDAELEEGWYTDPYGRHEARWMSEGLPTALVRDGAVEDQDPPPQGPYVYKPSRIVDHGTPSDVRRADDQEQGPVGDVMNNAVEEAWEVGGEAMP